SLKSRKAKGIPRWPTKMATSTRTLKQLNRNALYNETSLRAGFFLFITSHTPAQFPIIYHHSLLFSPFNLSPT
ncbi:hypothetical protein ACOV11_28300, partial [Vibrio natriegens]